MSKKHADKTDEETEDTSALKSAAEIAAERAANNASAIAEAGDSVQQDIDQLRNALAKAQDNWVRTQADLDNYRKRVTRERQDLIKTANEKLLMDLLAPIDHFEMGLQTTQKNPEDPLRQGMEMILAQFKQFLKTHGVTEIEAAGQTFDPALHEAVTYQESDQPEGQIVQQLRKGYRLNEKLLRPATVIVSKGQVTAPSSETPQE
jgi:molecular chaperone GrpE